MPTPKIAMTSCDTDGCKSIFLTGKGIVMVRNGSRDGESELVAKMGPPDPKSFGLEFL